MSGMSAGEGSGRHVGAQGWQCSLAGVVLMLVLAACGDDGAQSEASSGTTSGTSADTVDDVSETTTLPSCDVAQSVVVVNVFGAVTSTESDGDVWVADPEAAPVARSGAAEVVSAYRTRGYEILYISSLPAEMAIGDQPIAEALTVWLGANGFPIGENTRVWAPEGDGDFSVALIEELAHLSNAGVALDAGYAANEEEVFPLATGGILPENVYTVGEAAQDETSTSLPGESFEAHLPEVEAGDPICE